MIIGILGPAGAGKSTIAEFLVQFYGAKRYSLATPLKEIALNAFDFSREQVYGTQEQKEAPDERYGGKSARWFLQRLGTEGIRRVLGADFWTRECMRTIARDMPQLAVVDDLRFMNEADLFRAGGAKVVRVHPPADDEAEARASAAGAHASETEWRSPDVDFAIKPVTRGVPFLLARVEEICAKLGLGRTS